MTPAAPITNGLVSSLKKNIFFYQKTIYNLSNNLISVLFFFGQVLTNGLSSGRLTDEFAGCKAIIHRAQKARA